MSREWWRDAVVYQIYPRSFQDTDGNGVGDLEGIISRLDYLNDGTESSLGVDAIWLSPTFPSPMKDFGYDVSDYLGVHPDFGTMETMDRLIAECHRRNIRVLLDWVPNHSSDEHPWFLESRKSKSNARRDWYYWRPAKPDGSLPNNWRSVFGGPAWTLAEETGEYYLHSFLREQPDLNWRNPEVERAMMDVLRFWFERGIDGFRIDVIGMIIKQPDLADNPPNPEWEPGDRERRSQLWVNNRNYPENFGAMKRIRGTFDEYPDKVSVGEVFGTATEIAAFYGDAEDRGLHLAFNFQFIHETETENTPWDAETMKRIVRNAEATIPDGGQPCYAFGNHDRTRFISRHNADSRGMERARAAALLLLSLHSTPFIYYGEEIGMEDNDEIPEDRLRDPARLRTVGRDPERTPMQWTAEAGRGFSTVEPWLPYGRIDRSVDAQVMDPGSLLSLYRGAIRLRKRTPALHGGLYRELQSPEGTWLFERSLAGSPVAYFAMNTSLDTVVCELPEAACVCLATDSVLESTRPSRSLELPPLGAAIAISPG